MKRLWIGIWVMAVMALTGCSVMPAAVEQAALPSIPFPELLREAPLHVGQTVIVGGYVASVENRPDQTRLIALEAPLGVRREPGAKDLSRGRLMLIYEGFLDPMIYTEGRKITVAGPLLGSSVTDPDPEPFPYLRVAVEHIYLWPEPQPAPRDDYYYPYRGPWHYPYPHPWWWGHPYWW